MAQSSGVGSVVVGGLVLFGGYLLYKKLVTPAAAPGAQQQDSFSAALQKLLQGLSQSKSSGGGSGAGAGGGGVGAITKPSSTTGGTGTPTNFVDALSQFFSPDQISSLWGGTANPTAANDPLGLLIGANTTGGGDFAISPDGSVVQHNDGSVTYGGILYGSDGNPVFTGPPAPDFNPGGGDSGGGGSGGEIVPFVGPDVSFNGDLNFGDS